MSHRWPALILLGAVGCASGHGTMLERVKLTTYSPLSRNAELLRRVLSPLGFRHGQQTLASQGGTLVDQTIELAREDIDLYVPAGPQPPGGYGLLVFVSPVDHALDTRRWHRALDAHGVILASPLRSGNTSSVYERRVPLTLLTYENVRARYAVDPRRVYVGGLSGGARVAEIVALAYPDVFHGLLLNAGSTPLGGEHGLFLPPRDLFRDFEHTRIAYVTGARDLANLADDEQSRRSLRSWCVRDLEVLTPRSLAHELLDPASLEGVLTFFERPSRVDPADVESCNAALDRTVATRIAEVQAAISRNDRATARSDLDALDRSFGGLAAPASVELDGRLTP